MNVLGALLGLVLMIFLAETGELPILILALLLFLNVADEDTVVALARKLGKLYYKLNKGIWNLLGIREEDLKLNEVLNELLKKEANWRARRVSEIAKRQSQRDEVLKLIYKRIMEETGIEGVNVRSTTKEGS
ncbi:hypothetical protein EYM_01625 [Ignicoccus islandicus DSM 13165]|uniref:Uncharacterized protein n=1 Tax=Ignicoccus islandicus DSM 13165 TaxID=940295 RepID=A0A0U3ECQ0_9CREN|nr:hypothetical protein [Ignicoccus islandicus]ALU12227.1 hypothetical protein EYM_01625 [Ignicoccus islandicus DSM 13165]